MAEDITRNGISGSNQHDIGYEGEYRVIYDDITLGTYDNASDGNGNTFNVLDIYGFSRLGIVTVNVKAAGYVAQYDYDNNSIRVYQAGADGSALSEVSAGTALNIDLRVEIRGIE